MDLRVDGREGKITRGICLQIDDLRRVNGPLIGPHWTVIDRDDTIRRCWGWTMYDGTVVMVCHLGQQERVTMPTESCINTCS